MTFTPPATLREALIGGAVRFDIAVTSDVTSDRPAPARAQAPVRAADPGPLRCQHCDGDMTRVDMVRHGLELVFESCSACGTRQWTRDGLVVDFDELRTQMAQSASAERARDDATRQAPDGEAAASAA